MTTATATPPDFDAWVSTLERPRRNVTITIIGATEGYEGPHGSAMLRYYHTGGEHVVVLDQSRDPEGCEVIRFGRIEEARECWRELRALLRERGYKREV